MISFSPPLGEPSFEIQLITQPPQASVATGSSYQILFSLAMLPVNHSGLTDSCFTCNSNSHIYLISQNTASWKPKLGRRKNTGRKKHLVGKGDCPESDIKSKPQWPQDEAGEHPHHKSCKMVEFHLINWSWQLPILETFLCKGLTFSWLRDDQFSSNHCLHGQNVTGYCWGLAPYLLAPRRPSWFGRSRARVEVGLSRTAFVSQGGAGSEGENLQVRWSALSYVILTSNFCHTHFHTFSSSDLIE